MGRDIITKYYDMREPLKDRKYYNSTDELFSQKGRVELIGKSIIPSWLGIKNISFE